MDDGLVHPLVKTLPSLVNAILSWMIEIWMNNVGLTYCGGDTIAQFMISVEQDNQNCGH